MTSEEREIDLQDLIYRILLDWRQLLVWMLAGALALGVFEYHKAGSSSKASGTEEALSEVQAKKASLAENLTDEQVENVCYVREQKKLYQSLIEMKEEYCENSILMKEDPSAVPTIVLQYSIDNHYEVVYPTIEKEDNMPQIQQAYQSAVASEDVYQAAADAVGAGDSAGHIGEVISLSTIDNGFSVTLTYVNEEGVRAMAEVVKQTVADAYEGIRDVCGDFDIVLNGESYQLKVKQDLFDTQYNAMYQLANYKKNEAALTDDFSDTEQEYYDLLVEEEELETEEAQNGEEETVETSTVSTKKLLKYVLIGAAAGLFLGCCYRGLRYILSGRIYTTADVTAYGLQDLGVIPVRGGKRRPLDGVDHMLERIALGSRRDMTAEKALALAISYLEVLLAPRQQKQVMITGTDWSEEEKTLAARLQTALAEAGYEVKLHCGLLSDEKAIREASAAGNVVLLEKFGRTRLEELGREAKMLSANQLAVLGVVVVEPRLV